MQKRATQYHVKKRKDQPSGPYYIFWSENGRERKRSTGLFDHELAKAECTRLNAEAQERRVFGRAAIEDAVSFAFAAIQYIDAADTPTARDARQRFMAIPISAMGDLPIKDIDDDVMRVKSRKAYPLAASATRRRQFYAPTVAVLNWASKRPRVWCPPPTDIISPADSQPRSRFLTAADGDALAKATTNIYARAIVELLLSSGLRESELVNLDWADINLTDGEGWLHKTKTDAPRRFEFGPRARDALANLPDHQGRVARNQYGRPYIHKKNKGGRFNGMLAGACKRAMIERVTAHELRITWATWHYALYNRVDNTADLGGWRGEKGQVSPTLWRYIKMAPRNYGPTLKRYGFLLAIPLDHPNTIQTTPENTKFSANSKG